MPTVTVGYYAACAHCGRRTDIVWGRPTHLCQVCGKPFCKKCGVSYVCQSCLAQKPPDVQEMLTKIARSIPIGQAVGLACILGGPFLIVALLIELGDFFTGSNAMWLLVMLGGGLFFFCCYGIKVMWGGFDKVVRAVNQTYFGKDTKQLNFTGITKMGGFQQVPANLSPSMNISPGSFNTQQTYFNVPSTAPVPPTSTEFQFCPLCGGQVSATICQNCGSKICPKCGHPDPDKSARFCGSCGNVF